MSGTSKVAAPAAAVIAPAPALLALRCFLFIGVGASLIGQQRLPVGNRNLVIIRVNFRKSEKSVPIAAKVDKCCL